MFSCLKLAFRLELLEIFKKILFIKSKVTFHIIFDQIPSLKNIFFTMIVTEKKTKKKNLLNIKVAFNVTFHEIFHQSRALI